MVIQLSFITTSQTITAGEVLHGTLNIRASQSVRALRVDVYFRGKEYTKIKHGKQTHYSKQQIVRLNHPHYQVNETIRRCGQKLPEGSYQVPFSFRLPPVLPSSCKFQSNARIEYCLRAVVRGSGRILPDYQTRRIIHVFAKPQPIEIIPRNIPPFSHSVRSCGVIHQGRVVAAAKAKDTKLVPGQRLEVDLAMVNLSRASVHSVQATLVENEEWIADGHRRFHNINLASKSLAITSCKKLDATEYKESLKDRHLKARNLQLVAARLASSNSREVLHLSIPPVPVRARNSYSGTCMNIRHSLVITLLTNSFHTNPEIIIPIRIARGQRPGRVTTLAPAVSDALQEAISLPIASVEPIYQVDDDNDEAEDAPTIIAGADDDWEDHHRHGHQVLPPPQLALALNLSHRETLSRSDPYQNGSVVLASVAVPVRT